MLASSSFRTLTVILAVDWMDTVSLTEFEAAALEWFESLGYSTGHGPKKDYHPNLNLFDFLKHLLR